MSRILVVDDVEEYLVSLKNALKSDFEVITASTLEEAKRNTGASIDIALVDIKLSEDDPANKDGLLYLEWVKMNFPEIPVITMSAYREFDIAVDSLNLGASYFLRKPITITELKALLKMFMDRKRAVEELTELKTKINTNGS